MVNLLKKTALIFLLFMSGLRLFAPTSGSMVIFDVSPIQPFKPLINAIGRVETNFDTLAYNPFEKAAGYFQIRPIRIIDYNKRTGSNYTLNDMFDYEISEKIFLYYASEIGPYNFEKIARKWNGSGRKTILYWRRVQKYL